MQRRGESGQPMRDRRAPKAREAPNADLSVASLQEQLDRRTRERDEALEQQTATSEVLSIIRRSPVDAQPVFDAIVQSAARLCGAIFSVVYLCDGDRVRIAATKNFTPEATSQLQQRQELKRPDRSHAGGRAILDRAIIHIHDVLADTEYSRELALAGGWRAVLAVPLLRDGISVGALTVAKPEPKPFSDRQIQLLNTFADQALIAIDNVQLFDDVQKRTQELSESLEQQTATSEVLRIISSSPGELKPVFDAMLENATRICEAKFGNLSLYNGETFQNVALHNPPAQYAERGLREVIRPHPESGLAFVARTKQIAHIDDLRTRPPYLEGDPAAVGLADVAGARTLLIVPMLKESTLVGTIAIYRQEVRPFTEKQIELVTNFAAQAVIAIENTRLLNELRESLQQQTATADVLKVISSSPGELEPVFNAMLENATRICDASYGVLFIREGTSFRTAAIHNLPGALAEERRRAELIEPISDDPLGQLAATKQKVHIRDARTEAAYKKGFAPFVALVDDGGARTLLAMPLLREDELIGAFSIYRTEVRPFTDKQIELVQNFASQAVIAIENTRLLNELRQRTDDLSESLDQQTATSDVLKVISSSPGELEPVFQAMLENAVRICGAKFGNLMLREGDAFRIGATHGAPPAYVDYLHSEQVFRLNPGLGQLVKTKEHYHLADIAAAPTFGDKLREATVNLAAARTLIGVPMLKDDIVIGAIIIYRQEVRPFTDKQIELVKSFAAQAVIAIENTRLLSELRESLQQQTATADVLKVISSSTFDLQPVLDTLVESATRLCEAYDSVILLRDGERLRVRAHYGPIPVDFVDWPIGRGWVTGRAFIDHKPIHVHDLQAAVDEYPDGSAMAIRLGHRAILATPLMREDEAIGALMVRRTEVRPFTDKQIELVTTFADQAVIAIENVRLFDEVQARTRDLSESLQQQTATADVLKAISRSAFDLKTVLDALVEAAARLCEADQGTIARERHGVYLRVATYGFPDDFTEYVKNLPVVPERGTATGRALLEGKVVHIPDVQADPEYTFVEAQKLGGFRTILSVPMLREGTPIGVLTLTRHEVRPFTDKQMELVSTFADQAAIAIENVRLFESVEARTRELAKSLEDLRTAQDRLVQTEKLASLGQLTAGIAHEIKNPLNFVNNFSAISVELIDELQETMQGMQIDGKKRTEINELTDTLRGNLAKVVQHGKRADAIVKNMLLHSRQGSQEHRPVDINAIVEESLNLAYHGARAEKQGFNITLERSFDPTAGEADVFPQDITRVLLNLISNGFYAATKRRAETNGGDYEPTLAAATKNLGDRIEIRIRDNGTGIPPEVKEKMFNPFFTTKPAGEGTGLGLSISHDIIVKQHGGSIEVDTQPGVFTEFRIVLPRGAATLAGGSP